jgi:DNA polymerase
MGKVLELAMGYQGGPGAFVTFAQAYGMNLDEQADVIHAAIAPSYWADSFKKYEWAKEKKLTRGLSQKTWAACDAVKSAWRAANSQIVDYWKRTADAAKGAIAQPGKEFKAGRIVFRKAGGYLLAQLPSGRYLAYPSPRIAEDGSCDFSYMGVNQYTKKWERIKTYGGKVVENITQATACDLLGEAGIRLEEHGFRIVLSIHDEYIAEAAPDAPHEDMERIMAELPPWAEGLPLVAAGFESNRYKKE